jgi:major curlin subunit
MKFIKVAALAAIVVSGSAMAGSINQGGWGHGHGHGGYSGPNSTLNIYQTVAVTPLLPCRQMPEIQSEY